MSTPSAERETTVVEAIRQTLDEELRSLLSRYAQDHDLIRDMRIVQCAGHCPHVSPVF